MSGQLAGQQIYILRKGSQRTKGREAQKNNIMAAKAVAAAVRTNLGPKGMDPCKTSDQDKDLLTDKKLSYKG
jgi:chaperonin GroEL (HSP60 family)